MPAYQVQRSILISAPRQQVFDAVVDFNTWSKWSPWLCSDKEASVTVSSDPQSVGSTYHWVGPVVGEGEIEHKKIDPPGRIEDELKFIKPFRSVSNVCFEVVEKGEQTEISWNMKGRLPWFLFWLKSSLQTFIGMDFRRGLLMLKDFVQHGTIESNTEIRGVQPVQPLIMIGIRGSAQIENISDAMDACFGQLESAIKTSGIAIGNAKMISAYDSFNMKSGEMKFTCGYIVPSGTPLSNITGNPLVTVVLPGGQAMAVRHTGAYKHLGNAWSAAHSNMRHQKCKQVKKGIAYEIYRNNPDTTDSKDLVTDIFIPVR
jgi:effector-binding domain-containing protein/uncharacterized protein YndB with AHSA1/START domain